MNDTAGVQDFLIMSFAIMHVALCFITPTLYTYYSTLLFNLNILSPLNYNYAEEVTVPNCSWKLSS